MEKQAVIVIWYKLKRTKTAQHSLQPCTTPPSLTNLRQTTKITLCRQILWSHDRHRLCPQKQRRASAISWRSQSSRTYPRIDQIVSKHCHFETGSEIPEGTSTIEFTIGDMWLEFDVHVASADVLIFLGLPHMGHPGKYFDNLNDFVGHPATGQKKSTTRKFGHTFV